MGLSGDLSESAAGRRVRLLEDKVALITGSSRGIGADIARLFAEHGAKVALRGRDMAALAVVRSELSGTVDTPFKYKPTPLGSTTSRHAPTH